MGTEFMLEIMKKFGYRQWGRLHNIVNVFSATELYIYKWSK